MSRNTFSSSGKTDVVDRVNRYTVLPTEELEPTYYKRTVSAGNPVSGSLRISEFMTTQADGYTLRVLPVSSYQEYISGCRLHGSECYGHYCITPGGHILLPQRLATTLGVMSNDYARMAENLFERDTKAQEVVYRERLRSLMLGKEGGMRGGLSGGTVDCSAREVISICWHLEAMSMEQGGGKHFFAIPSPVARNIRVLKVGTDEETGLPIGVYVEDCAHEGDHVLVHRPPTLWAGNVQPATLVTWDHACFGLQPSVAADFHADHDGDEMHLHFLSNEESKAECRVWKRLSGSPFIDAVDNLPHPSTAAVGRHGLLMSFMQHSTVSMRELMEGVKLPPIAGVSRMKDMMTNMMAENMRNPLAVATAFPDECTRGVCDVMKQQISQGALGYMSRQGKLPATCAKYEGHGVFRIFTSTASVTVVDPSVRDITGDHLYPLGGNACMRAMCAICSKSQQSALDSHRVRRSLPNDEAMRKKPGTAESLMGFDLIESFMSGSDPSLMVVSGEDVPDALWKYTPPGNITYCFVRNAHVGRYARRIVATYSPVGIKAARFAGSDVLAICKRGILVVCKVHGVSLTELELSALAVLMCHEASSSHLPVTVRDGMPPRHLRWLPTLFNSHYGEMRQMQRAGLTNRYVKLDTIVEAVSHASFGRITGS